MTDGEMAKTEKSTKTITLSARMQALADMVTEGNRVCDLGCDHGFLSIYLVQRQISPGVLAMDVGKGPLMRAEEHVRKAELQNYITLRLSDGLKNYRVGEADTLLCAGMGGPLMQRLLAEEPEKAKSFRELILQPQSEIASFRKFLREAGFIIASENMVLEEGKFYPMLKAQPAERISGMMRARLQPDMCKKPEKKEQISRELGDRFGAHLLAQRHPVLWEYLKREWKNCGELKSVLKESSESQRAQRRFGELLRETTYLKEAAKLYGKDYD